MYALCCRSRPLPPDFPLTPPSGCPRPAVAHPFQQAYGSSMTPTLATKGDVVLLDMSAPYRWRAARRYGDRANTVLTVGDVVTLSKPTDRRVSIIKRIGGLVCALTSSPVK